MIKRLPTALLVLLVLAGSAFGLGQKSGNATFNNGLLPTSTNNDDSCEIANFPAATLLLPYFEVDFNSPPETARTTLFTIANTSRLPQIVHLTLWTDWSFAALDFNIFLTGYDVQSINLYDIFKKGIIAPNVTGTGGGTSSNTTVPTNPSAGSQPFANDANPNVTSLMDCSNLPGIIPTQYLIDIDKIFTTGTVGTIIGAGCTRPVGGVHANAIGYVTMDVIAVCSTSLPGDPGFFAQLLYDNVLTGDYQDVNPNPVTGNYAGGNPLVHIRAVPEGGPAGSVPGTNLPFTFYDRYTAGIVPRTIDRRQPLPATFAARFIQGGTTGFNTNYKIWREGISFNGTSCAANGVILNSALTITEVVRFDEHENATTLAPPNQIISPPVTPGANVLPETSATSTASGHYPMLSSSGDVAGWMYLNLDNHNVTTSYSVARAGFDPPGPPVRPSQNWVIVSMFAEGRFSVDFDATMLGNGCSPAIVQGNTIGPVGGVPVCPAGVTCTPAAAYTGTNATP